MKNKLNTSLPMSYTKINYVIGTKELSQFPPKCHSMPLFFNWQLLTPTILTHTCMRNSNVELGSLVCTSCHFGHVIYLVFLNFCFFASVMSNQLIFQLLQAALICLMFLWDIIIIIIFNALVMVPKVSVIFSGLFELNIPIQLGIETTHVKNGFLWVV